MPNRISIAHMVEASGRVHHSPKAPTTYISENAMIQGIRRPVISASAPISGAPKPMISPVTARHSDQTLCARASAASSSRPVVRKYSAATPAK